MNSFTRYIEEQKTYVFHSVRDEISLVREVRYAVTVELCLKNYLSKEKNAHFGMVAPHALNVLGRGGGILQSQPLPMPERSLVDPEVALAEKCNLVLRRKEIKICQMESFQRTCWQRTSSLT